MEKPDVAAAAPRVAVVGAGMAGLACAFHLQQAGARVSVFEEEAAVGGRTRSVRQQGYLFDLGAITLSPAYANTLALLKRAGGAHLLKPIQPVLGIARAGVVHEIDLAAPLASLRRLKLLSASGYASLTKLLPLLVQTWGRSDFEGMAKLARFDLETCRDFALRTNSREAYDFLVDPIIRLNMFTGGATSSVVDLLWLLRMFAGRHLVQIEGGMGRMSEVLARDLDVRLAAAVTDVSRRPDRGVRVTTRGGAEDFDAVVIATPPPIAMEICKEIPGQIRPFLAAVEPVPAITVQVGLKRRPQGRAAAVMLSGREYPDVLAIGLEHNKFPDRAPRGGGVLTVHMHGDWAARHGNADDQVIVEEALGSVADLVGDLRGDVITSHVQRWGYVDHVRRPGVYKALQAADFGHQSGPILFAGEYISAGIEGAVISGTRCAEAALRQAGAA